jgi:hypothetical protein
MAYTNELAFKNTLLTAALTTRDLKQKKRKENKGKKLTDENILRTYTMRFKIYSKMEDNDAIFL